MSDFENIDVGEEEGEVVPPRTLPPNPLKEEPSDFGGLDEDETIQLESIKTHSVSTILMALMMRRTGSENEIMALPMEQWPFTFFSRYSGVVAAMGPSRGVEEDLGRGNYSDALRMYKSGVPTNVLMARLIKAKESPASHVTDGTIATDLCNYRGVTITQDEDYCYIHAPGAPCALKVYRWGILANRAVDGSEVRAIVDWLNVTYKLNLIYEVIPPAAVSLALFLSFECDFKIAKEKGDTVINFVECLPSKSGLSMAFRSPKFEGWSKLRQATQKMVKSTYAKPEYRVSIGHNAHPLAFLECLISRGLRSRSDADIKVYVAYIRELGLAHKKLVSRLRSANPDFMGEINNDAVKSFLSKNPALRGPSGHPLCATYAHALAFVTGSRDQVRDAKDLARKSDSPGMGSVCASATSVPWKIEATIALLERVGANFSLPVHAYGTGKSNHWHRTLTERFASVSFRDKDGSFAPRLGGEFLIDDIEMLQPGSGKGRILMDDTYNGPDGKPEQYSAAAKIAAIVSADYECGVTKLYLGGGEDGAAAIGVVPPSIQSLKTKYSVLLSPGGSPHSPEYFAVFYKGDQIGPIRTAVGFEIMPNKVNLHYMPNWFVTRTMEMIRANVLINAQISSRISSKEKISLPTYGYSPKKLFLSGVYHPLSHAPRPLVDKVNINVGDEGEGVEDPGDGKLSIGLGGANHKGDGPYGFTNSFGVQFQTDYPTGEEVGPQVTYVVKFDKDVILKSSSLRWADTFHVKVIVEGDDVAISGISGNVQKFVDFVVNWDRCDYHAFDSQLGLDWAAIWCDRCIMSQMD